MTINDAAAIMQGNRSFLGFGEEETYGTAATPDTWLKFVSEGLQRQVQRLESQALSASELQEDWADGGRSVAGDITLELSGVAEQALLWRHAFGAVQSDAVPDTEGVYAHVLTPGDINDLWLTTQVVRGGELPFTYVGCKVNQLQLSCSLDQIAQLVVGIIGRDELLNVSAGEPSYPTPYPLMSYVGGGLFIAGTELAVNQAELTWANNLSNRGRFGSAVGRNPQREGAARRELTGSFNADFNDLSLYNRFVTGEEAELVLRFATLLEIEEGHPWSVEVKANVRFDGPTPTVGGPGEIRQEVQWRAFPSAEVPTGVEVTLINDVESIGGDDEGGGGGED